MQTIASRPFIVNILLSKATLTTKNLTFHQSIQNKSYSVLQGHNIVTGNKLYKAIQAIINSPHFRRAEVEKLAESLESSMVKAKASLTTAEKSNQSSSSIGSSRDSLYSSSKTIKSHSSLKSARLSNSTNMRIIPLRALQDNYMYLLVDETTWLAAAVDPVNASAMASAIHDQGVELKAILTTHHHHDHAHGNADMLGMYPDIDVYGGDSRIQALTKSVNHGDTIKVGALTIECLSTPCHTRGHICYYVTCDSDSSNSSTGSPQNGAHNSQQQQQQQSSQQERAVFTGDTLFIAGCGRFFEGSSEQMDHNLNVILANLPPDTRIYCGHEYTVTNLKFALSVEPQNLDIKSKLNWALSKMAKKEPTVPSTIGEEKKINPFMRLKRTQVKKYTGETDELEVMTVLRHRKNEFQP